MGFPLTGMVQTRRYDVAKILIVEDNEINLLLARELVRKAFPDLEILTAEDGVEAVEKALGERPQVILMDIQMPRKDGFTATREILAADPDNYKPQIIALTASTIRKHDERSEGLEIEHFITKPLDPDLLRQVIARALD